MCEVITSVPGVDFVNQNDLNSSLIIEKKKIAIVVQNIRSMRKNFDNFLVHLESSQINPDIIFLTEIWLYDDEIDNYKINNYVCHANCNNNYASGGVIVFCRNDIICDISNLPCNSADILRLDTFINERKVTFICIYSLHSQSITTFLSDITIILNNLKNKNVVLLGDMIIDILPPINENVSLDYLYLMSSFGFESLVNSVTRPSSGTCIDHVFSRSLPCLNFNVTVNENNITDHSMISINLCQNILEKKVINNDYIKKN